MFGLLKFLFVSAITLVFLIPAALVLAVVGLPIAAVLGVLALPVLIVLFIVGLPIFLVLLAGGLAMGVLFAVLAFGLVALKIAIFVVLPIWLVYKTLSWIFRDRKGGVVHTDTPPATDA